MADTTASERPQVFLSFDVADHRSADRVAAVLDGSGLDVQRFVDAWDNDTDDRLRASLRRSAAVV